MIQFTLRYLLAYMDEQLEPADAQEMARMIEASPAATELMHRLRDISRRLKLGTPPVESRGVAGDANAVAEYLDNTMPPERVVEFEKICRSSEIHLAELASAHQILALVLRERAEVDPQMRRRMYALQHRTEAAEDGSDAALHADEDHEAVEVAPAAGKSRRRRPEIPEWLREPTPRRRNWLPLAVAALVLVGVGIGAAYVFFKPTRSPTGVVAQAGGANDQSASTQGSQSAAPSGAPTDVTADADRPPIGDVAAGAPGESPGAGDIATANGGAANIGPAAGDIGANVGDAAPMPGLGGNVDRSADQPQPGVSGIEPPSPGAASPADNVPASPPQRNVGLAATVDPNDPFNTDIGPNPSTEAPTALTDQNLVPRAAVPDVATDRGGAEAGKVTVGRLINDERVLLRAGIDGAWRRLSTRDALAAGEELFAVPTFRPLIALQGVTVHLLGGSMIRLMTPDAAGVPGINVLDGQLVVATAGKPGTLLNLELGGELYRITFLTADATMAVDVRHVLPDGADPLTAQVKTTVDLYVQSGEIEYSAPTSGGSQTMKFPAFRRLIAVNAPSEVAGSTENTFPAWINGNQLNTMETKVANLIEKTLKPGDPVEQRLRELSEDQHFEIRDLAIHCLTLLGDFGGVLPLLGDPLQRNNWSEQIEAVRRTLARNPQLADSLRATLASRCDSKKAKDVYDMLLGFSRRQLQDGAAARLVGDLNHDDLDLRVLAFWNLQRVQVGTQNYDPRNDAVKRRTSVRAWQEKLKNGELVPKGA